MPTFYFMENDPREVRDRNVLLNFFFIEKKGWDKILSWEEKKKKTFWNFSRFKEAGDSFFAVVVSKQNDWSVIHIRWVSSPE